MRPDLEHERLRLLPAACDELHVQDVVTVPMSPGVVARAADNLVPAALEEREQARRRVAVAAPRDPLMPDDQVYVGETKQSSLSRVLPDWLGTVYRRVTGLLPDDWWPFGKMLKPAIATPGTSHLMGLLK